jgi:hypothetical protein
MIKRLEGRRLKTTDMSGEGRVPMTPDSDPLARHRDFQISGVSEVIRTVDVVVDDEQYRLEITRSVSNQSAPFDVRCYRFERVGEKTAVQDTYAYVYQMGFPFASSNTANKALTSALSDLRAWNASITGTGSLKSEQLKQPSFTKDDFEKTLKKISRPVETFLRYFLR